MLDRVGMRSLNETNKTMGRSCGDAPATARTVRSKESAFPGGRAHVDRLARTARYDQVGSAGIVARRTNIRTGMARRYFAAWEEHVGDLITPEELPKWGPGDLTLDSASLAVDGLRIRGYRFAGSDVPVPALRDYVIVVYKEGVTPMHRRCDSGWRS